MPKYDVLLFPVLSLQIRAIDAENPLAAIAQAVTIAEQRLNVEGEADLTYADEFARYVVDQLIDGQVDSSLSQTYLDGPHVEADQRDLESGLPVYQHPDEAARQDSPSSITPSVQ